MKMIYMGIEPVSGNLILHCPERVHQVSIKADQKLKDQVEGLEPDTFVSFDVLIEPIEPRMLAKAKKKESWARRIKSVPARVWDLAAVAVGSGVALYYLRGH